MLLELLDNSRSFVHDNIVEINRANDNRFLRGFHLPADFKLGEKLGQGFHHRIYQHATNTELVIKIPRNLRFMPTRNPLMVQLQNKWAKTYFEAFYLPTQVHCSTDTNNYIITQKKYDGISLTLSDLDNAAIKAQFKVLMNANNKMVNYKGFTIDLQGGDKFKRWLKSPFMSMYIPALSNVVIEYGSNQLKLTDYDFLNTTTSLSISSRRTAFIFYVSYLCQNLSLIRAFDISLRASKIAKTNSIP